MAEKETFFDTVKHQLETFNILPSDKLILGGDWNSIQNTELDKKGGKENPMHTVTKSMKDLVNNWNFLDIWRILNPLKKRYTYRQK